LAVANPEVTRTMGGTLSRAPSVEGLEGLLPGLNIIGFDTFSFVDAAIANPGAFGFTNVSDPCFNGVTVCANPDQYVFWDLVHPTARSHELLGNAFAAAVVPEPPTLALCAIAVLPTSPSRAQQATELQLTYSKGQFQPSEFSLLSLQARRIHDTYTDRDGDAVFLKWTFNIGPHGAHPY